MDTRINTRSVKIHIYSPSLTTVIGFFWAWFNSVDEADTELKLLIQAHNRKVRSQGRERGWGKHTPNSASIGKTRGLKSQQRKKYHSIRLEKSCSKYSISFAFPQHPEFQCNIWDMRWCRLWSGFAKPLLLLVHLGGGRKTSDRCVRGTAVTLRSFCFLTVLCCWQRRGEQTPFPAL